MSVTFSLQSNESFYPECSRCGATARKPSHDESCSDSECMGYGPERVDSTPSLNVANTNARVILRDLLGYGPEMDELWGSLDPDDVLLRLSMAGYRATEAVRPTTQQGIMISCGLDRSRIERYIERLTEIAEIAKRRGEEITFG